MLLHLFLHLMTWLRTPRRRALLFLVATSLGVWALCSVVLGVEFGSRDGKADLVLCVFYACWIVGCGYGALANIRETLRERRARRWAAEGRCPHCGQWRLGATGNVCPECGQAV